MNTPGPVTAPRRIGTDGLEPTGWKPAAATARSPPSRTAPSASRRTRRSPPALSRVPTAPLALVPPAPRLYGYVAVIWPPP